jgi:2-keto-3-deoxy-L-rhamnonate aldolase RhmA
MSMPDYLQTANDEIATIVLIEKARGREARR